MGEETDKCGTGEEGAGRAGVGVVDDAGKNGEWGGRSGSGAVVAIGAGVDLNVMVVIVVEVVVVMVIVVVMALIMAATLAELSEASSRRNNGRDLAAAMAVVVSGMLALRTSELSSSSEMISMLSLDTALDNREGVTGAVFRRERSSATITGGSVLDSIE